MANRALRMNTQSPALTPALSHRMGEGESFGSAWGLRVFVVLSMGAGREPRRWPNRALHMNTQSPALTPALSHRMGEGESFGSAWGLRVFVVLSMGAGREPPRWPNRALRRNTQSPALTPALSHRMGEGESFGSLRGFASLLFIDLLFEAAATSTLERWAFRARTNSARGRETRLA